MLTELKYFSIWIIKGNKFLLTLNWIFFKINKKFINKKKYIYPNEIQDYLDGINIPKPKSVKIKELKKTNINFKLKKIKLASMSININNKDFDWQIELDDSEDNESLHRWNWMIKEISNKNSKVKYDELIFYQRDWYKNFITDLDNISLTKKYLRWTSYTVAERISNTVLISNYFNKDIPLDIIESLREQSNFLATNLEYFERDTGNHIINNARAIYLYSSYIKDNRYMTLAKLIFKDQLHRLITKDGFLREGSSHYHFLFLRWILEVYIFSKKNNDVKFSYYLKDFILKLHDVSHNFLFCSKDGLTCISLFGDISPDFEPKWLASLVYSHVMPFKMIGNVNISIPDCSWNHLWKNEKEENKITVVEKYSNFLKNTKNYNPSGWFFLNNEKFRVQIRASIKSIENNVGHYSHDLFHCNLFFNNQPFLISLGRLNYKMNDDIGISGLVSSSHNAIFINKQSYIPKNVNLFPKEYAQANNHIYSNNNYLGIKSDGFKRINNSIIAQREFKISTNNVLIKDIIEGVGKYKINRIFYIDNNYILIENNLIDNSKRVLKFKNDNNIINFEILGENINSNELLITKNNKNVSSYGNYKNCTSININSEELLPSILKVKINN